MFSLFKELTGVVTNVAQVVVAPIEVVATIANAAVKPVADVTKELVQDVKNSVK